MRIKIAAEIRDVLVIVVENPWLRGLAQFEYCEVANLQIPIIQGLS